MAGAQTCGAHSSRLAPGTGAADIEGSNVDGVAVSRLQLYQGLTGWDPYNRSVYRSRATVSTSPNTGHSSPTHSSMPGGRASWADLQQLTACLPVCDWLSPFQAPEPGDPSTQHCVQHVCLWLLGGMTFLRAGPSTRKDSPGPVTAFQCACEQTTLLITTVP